MANVPKVSLPPLVLLIMQSVLSALQFINLSIALLSPKPTVQLIFGAIVTGLQNFVQHVGNQTDPTGTDPELIKSAQAASRGGQ